MFMNIIEYLKASPSARGADRPGAQLLLASPQLRGGGGFGYGWTAP